MDDLQEQNEIAEEIANAISQPIGFAQELDDVCTVPLFYDDSCKPCDSHSQLCDDICTIPVIIIFLMVILGRASRGA